MVGVDPETTVATDPGDFGSVAIGLFRGLLDETPIHERDSRGGAAPALRHSGDRPVGMRRRGSTEGLRCARFSNSGYADRQITEIHRETLLPLLAYVSSAIPRLDRNRRDRQAIF